MQNICLYEATLADKLEDDWLLKVRFKASVTSTNRQLLKIVREKLNIKNKLREQKAYRTWKRVSYKLDGCNKFITIEFIDK